MDDQTPSGGTIRFRVLGTAELKGPNGNELLSVLARPKLLAILSYLAANSSGGFTRRETLVGLFWADVDPDRARNSLRQSLHHLRRSLGADVLLSRGDDEVGLAPGAIWCDVTAFEESLAAGRNEEALNLYSGELLDGFFVAEAPGFEHWLEVRRGELRGKAAVAAWVLAEEAESSRDSTAAGRWARRALELAPLDEDLVRRAIAFLDRLGDRSGAVQEYEAFARRLSAELELEPAPETQSLVESVRARKAQNGGPTVQKIEPPARTAQVRPTPIAPAGRRWGFRLGLIAGAAIVMGLVVIGSFQVFSSSEEALDVRRVLVTAFDNETGDPTFDPVGRMAADWITQGIRQTGLLEAVPPEATLRLVAAEDRPDEEERTVAELTGAGTVISGAVYLLDDSLQFQAHVTDVADQRILVSVESNRSAAHDPGPGLESLRQRVVGALAMTHDGRIAPFANVALRPPTFEAYRAFAEGEELYNRSFTPGNSHLQEEALRLLLRAFELDTTLRAAQLRAASAMAMLGRRAQADSIGRIVLKYRDELSPFGRAELDVLIADLRGDRLGALEAARRQAQTPLDPGAHAIWANHPAEAAERLENAEWYSAAIRSAGLYGIDQVYWLQLADAYHMLGDYEASLKTARRAREHYPNVLSMLAKEAMALAAQGKVDQVNDLLNESLALPPQEGWSHGFIMRVVALDLRAHGYKKESLAVAERAVDWQRSLPSELRSTRTVRFNLGVAYYVAERWGQAQALFEELTSEDPDHLGSQGFLAVLAARRGDRDEALERSTGLVGLADPYNHGREQYWQACVAAQLGDLERAMILLREAYARGRRFEVGLHLDLDLEPLHDFRPFQEFLAPKG
ncbi:MAG: hypothetical protein JSU87_03305 [Gemmatimonadota bacterium]|nr:MAG: hypothetical protein JSU87_03305 [Gemmatimonadota bacterium]